MSPSSWRVVAGRGAQAKPSALCHHLHRRSGMTTHHSNLASRPEGGHSQAGEGIVCVHGECHRGHCHKPKLPPGRGRWAVTLQASDFPPSLPPSLLDLLG